MEYVSPNETISSTDDKSISLAIKKAKETGIDKVVIPRQNQRTGSEKWIIEDTILWPDRAIPLYFSVMLAIFE
jgi:hypothetical protein